MCCTMRMAPSVPFHEHASTRSSSHCYKIKLPDITAVCCRMEAAPGLPFHEYASTCSSLLCYETQLLKTKAVHCRMEAAPSVPFHERAPDLLKEEDIQGSQLSGLESDDPLPSRAWPRHEDAENHVPQQDRQKADISYEHGPEPALQGMLSC